MGAARNEAPSSLHHFHPDLRPPHVHEARNLDKDDTVLYAGGTLEYGASKVKYPSAKETVAHWAAHEGCAGGLVPGGADLDLVTSSPGADTTIERYDGCAKGAVELWTVKGGVHAPPFGVAFGPALWTFVEADPQP